MAIVRILGSIAFYPEALNVQALAKAQELHLFISNIKFCVVLCPLFHLATNAGFA